MVRMGWKVCLENQSIDLLESQNIETAKRNRMKECQDLNHLMATEFLVVIIPACSTDQTDSQYSREIDRLGSTDQIQSLDVVSM